jgi:hypothetical protein
MQLNDINFFLEICFIRNDGLPLYGKCKIITVKGS